MTTKNEAAAPTAEETVEEMTESLTGFDEIAIAAKFHAEWHEMAEARPTFMLRSLAFVHQRRKGLTDAEAYEAALSLPMGVLNTYFTPDPEEPMPDDPISESGKGDGSPA